MAFVDAVVSSELYGTGCPVGAEHLCVDSGRTAVPASASENRADLAARGTI